MLRGHGLTQSITTIYSIHLLESFTYDVRINIFSPAILSLISILVLVMVNIVVTLILLLPHSGSMEKAVV